MFAILVRSGAFLLVPRKLKTAAFMKHHCRFMTVDNNDRKSVSGIVYEASTADSPTIRLFTKVGCTLCDKVKDVLASVEPELPHRLVAVDITDDENSEWFSKYKYDIPVLHVGDKYWVKHRLSPEDAREGLAKARSNSFNTANEGEPNAGEMERRQAERAKQKSADENEFLNE